MPLTHNNEDCKLRNVIARVTPFQPLFFLWGGAVSLYISNALSPSLVSFLYLLFQWQWAQPLCLPPSSTTPSRPVLGVQGGGGDSGGNARGDLIAFRHTPVE